MGLRLTHLRFSKAARFLCASVICCLFCLNALGQEQVDFEFDPNNRSAYIIQLDSCALSQDALNAIGERLKMTFSISQRNVQTWNSDKRISRKFYYSFSFLNLTAKRPVEIRSSVGDYKLDTGEQVCAYGFTTDLGEGKKVDRNFSSFLLSAYRQHTEPEYNDYAFNFTTLKELSVSEYSKRNWISMGYGLNYLAKDNPFMARNKGTIVGLYVFEALHYAAIIGGPLLGPTNAEKVLLPITGLVSLVFWKGIVMRHFIAPPAFKMNKRIIDSGYKLPHELIPEDDYY